MVDKGERRAEREKYLEEFGEKYKHGLVEFLENIEMFGSGAPNPGSLDMGDERDFEELDADEIGKIKDVLYGILGVEPSRGVRNYKSRADDEARVPGKIEVNVFETNIVDIFLHEMTYADGAVRWLIGPNEEI